jgi:hypothetical protein
LAVPGAGEQKATIAEQETMCDWHIVGELEEQAVLGFVDKAEAAVKIICS